MQSAKAPLRPLSVADDDAVLIALRSGDEQAFSVLVDAYSPGMLRFARTLLPSRAVAEEVVQETWLAVLRGIDRFERRSSLKTWIYQILMNIGNTRAVRERRSAPMSALGDGTGRRAVDADRFSSAGCHGSPGRWALPPAPWPEHVLLAQETRSVVAGAIDELSPAQRAVISLRDVEGWSAEETCDALGLSEGNQRVLLHRARSRVRAAIETYLGAVEVNAA
jgi:RNA polymerase sigma-70 factor (ECF subfamily)